MDSTQKQALLSQVANDFGGANMNMGQQIAFNQVASDLTFSPLEVATYLNNLQTGGSDSSTSSVSPSFDTSPVLGKSAGLKSPITQPFGAYNPSTEKFSKGFNSGVDIGVAPNTPVHLPPGKWQVVETYSGDSKPGYIGDSTNRGYGNSVLVKNADTGEELRFSHLNAVYTPSKVLEGGSLIGLSGQTGNVTGPHLDLEYYNSKGQLGDALSTPYAKGLGL